MKTKSLSLRILVLCLLLVVGASAKGQSNPEPFISQLSPLSVAPGGPSFTVTVQGAGFVPGSVVYWNGTQLATTFVSASQLAAVVPSADIVSAGPAQVTVSPISNVAYLGITSPEQSLVFRNTDYGGVPSPVSMAVGDFNHDGNPDLVVADGSANQINVLFGNSDGTFQPPVAYNIGASAISIAVGDFGHTGFLDLAVGFTYSGGSLVMMLQNDETGHFFQTRNLVVGVTSLSSIATGDFNGDGNLDLVVTDRAANTVNVLLGPGLGSFTSYEVGSPMNSVAVGDFNGDGILDLVACGSGNVSVLLGNGDGSFQAAVNYPLPSNYQAYSVAVGDFNADGKMDLAIALVGPTNNFQLDALIMLGNGDGSFRPPVVYKGSANNNGEMPTDRAIAVGDLNGDGNLDVVLANSLGASVLLGNGDGTFHAYTNYQTSAVAYAFSVAMADFNGDGRMDLAIGNYLSSNISILLQPTQPSGFAELNGGNSITGNQTVNGSVTATSFAGNGSGLTNVIASSANNANFAISAGDAMTLGGIPATGFAPASGSANYVAKGGDTMTGTLNLPLNGLAAGGNQLVLSGGNVGIGTASPGGLSGYTSLHIDHSATGFGGAFLELSHSAGNTDAKVVSDDNGFLLEASNPAPVKIKSGNFNGPGDPGNIYISTSGNVGIATGTPAATLEVNGTAKFDSTVTFAPGQTFPGVGNGTITGVGAGTGLSGGGTSGNVVLGIQAGAVTDAMLANPSLSVTAGAGLTGGGSVSLGGTTTVSLATNTCAAGTAVTAHPFTCTAFPIFGANTFTGTQAMPNLTVSGTGNFGHAPDFTGVLSAATANATAAVVGVTAGAGTAVLGWNTNSVGDMFEGTNANGLQFAVNHEGDVRTTGNIAAGGSVTIGGGTPIAEYVSTTESLTIPALTPGSCTTFTTAALMGFTPGSSDTIALGTPSSLVSGLGSGVFLLYQAWETTTTASPTITIQVCNPTGVKYKGGATGTIRIDVFTH